MPRLVKIKFVLEYVIPYLLTILANSFQENWSKLYHLMFLRKNKIQLCGVSLQFIVNKGI